MGCPICDQKAANCDCTKAEIEQHESIEELMEENANLKAEVKRLRKRLSGFGECPECGNMTTAFGTSGKCGECGAEIE